MLKMYTKETIWKIAIINVILGGSFLAVWTLISLSGSGDRTFYNVRDLQYHHEHLAATDPSKYPRLSADKSTLVVTSEDALGQAFEFLRLNMYLPIKKIVLMKPGAPNDTVRVYPIPREGMIGLKPEDVPLSGPEIGFLVFFLVFILGSFVYIFTSISGIRYLWEEDGWCFEENDNVLGIGDDDSSAEEEINKKLTEEENQRSEKKRKEIEEV